jgi:hypothetical protein
MSAAREISARSVRVPIKWGGVAMAALAMAAFAAAAEAKVTWGGSASVRLHQQDGRRVPLLRAERLARHQAFMVQRFGPPFLPSLFMPHPLYASAFGTAWLWPDGGVTAFVPGCDGAWPLSPPE